MFPRKYLIFGKILFVSTALFGAYPLTTDDIGTVDINKFEVETSYDNCGNNNELWDRSCAFSLKHGVTEKMDIGLSFPIKLCPCENERVGAAVLGLKFLLFKNIAAFSFSNELGGKEYFLNGIISKELSPVIAHVNAGYLATGDETLKGAMTHGCGLEYPIGRFGLVGEIVGEEMGLRNWLAGVRYRIDDYILIGGAVSDGLGDVNDRVTVGLHTEF